MNNRSIVSFTPGVNKRRLTRDTNNTIGGLAKIKVPIDPLPEISMTKPKHVEKEEKAKEESIKKVDPLKKFSKKEDEESNMAQSSWNFLKQFGATPDAKPERERKFYDFNDPPKTSFDLKIEKSKTIKPRRLEKKEDSGSNGSQSLKWVPSTPEIVKFKKNPVNENVEQEEDQEETKDKVNPINYVAKRKENASSASKGDMRRNIYGKKSKLLP
jgi:hypothetical protein